MLLGVISFHASTIHPMKVFKSTARTLPWAVYVRVVTTTGFAGFAGKAGKRAYFSVFAGKAGKQYPF